jgi:DNA-binding transcriptional LysR family regulator
MKLSLRQIEIFAAIARTENVSRAAEQLAMSQSAASSALVELERQFDCPLFDRIGKSLHLNGTGRALLPQAENMLAQAADIETFLSGNTLVPLAVGATLTIGNYLATLVVAEYLQRQPTAKIGLQVANTQSIVERLTRYELDIGLIEGEVNHPDLILSPWIDDALVVFCAPHHPLALSREADAERLSDEKWIVRERGSGTRQLFDRAIAGTWRAHTFNWSWSTPKRSSVRSNQVSGLVACRACPCAKPFGAAVWSKSTHLSSIFAGTFTLPSTGSATSIRRCKPSSICAGSSAVRQATPTP